MVKIVSFILVILVIISITNISNFMKVGFEPGLLVSSPVLQPNHAGNKLCSLFLHAESLKHLTDSWESWLIQTVCAWKASRVVEANES